MQSSAVDTTEAGVVFEGALRKWTNYWNGWQSRWFVLEKGTLSYYQSQDTVQEGCKGAVNVAAAEISAHPSDPYRLDVVVPGEQHFYLKAADPHERQEWLVALGSLKTCINSRKASKGLVEEDNLKRKQCELRLYCDLLVQQVHSIKSAVIDNPLPDVQKLDASTSLLSETCDTFIKTLEDCVSAAGPPSPFTKCPVSPISATRPKSPRHRSRTSSSNQSPVNGHVTELAPNSKPPFKTFFSEDPYSFSQLRLNEDGSVPTRPFLDACLSLTKVFDILGSTAFTPVKMDMTSNIRKLNQKYESDEGRFDTLHKIVLSEVEKGTTQVQNSATDALLWLKRGINFVSSFLSSFQSDEQKQLSECANDAYANVLKRHHSWVVRGVYNIAANAMPQRQDFVVALLLGNQGVERQLARETLNSQLTSYIAGIGRVLRSVNKLYKSNDLDSDLLDI